MIAWLEGVIFEQLIPGKIVLNVNGVGYDLEVSLQTFFALETYSERVSLYVHTVVREDAFLLYGFLKKLERSLFIALIKVNGVGPKMAMSILSGVTPEVLIEGIIAEDLAFLMKLPGIGKKMAERLIIDMRDVVQTLSPSLESISKRTIENSAYHTQSEAMSALEALGYKQQAVHQMIKKIDNGQKSCEQLIREALKAFSLK